MYVYGYVCACACTYMGTYMGIYIYVCVCVSGSVVCIMCMKHAWLHAFLVSYAVYVNTSVSIVHVRCM